MSAIHTVAFHNEDWTASEARAWLRLMSHHIRPKFRRASDLAAPPRASCCGHPRGKN